MSLSFTALLLIAHGIVSDTSCRPVECLKHATMFVPSFALRPLHPLSCSGSLSFWQYNVLYPPPPPHLTTPLVPHEIVFDMTSNQNNVRASVSLSVRQTASTVALSSMLSLPVGDIYLTIFVISDVFLLIAPKLRSQLRFFMPFSVLLSFRKMCRLTGYSMF